jgi:hypothetical protein
MNYLYLWKMEEVNLTSQTERDATPSTRVLYYTGNTQCIYNNIEYTARETKTTLNHNTIQTSLNVAQQHWRCKQIIHV